MLNKTTSPRLEKWTSAGSFFVLTLLNLKAENVCVFSPRGIPETAAIPLISSPKGLGRVSTMRGCKTWQNTVSWSYLWQQKERQRQRDKTRLTSVMSTSSISFPLGTNALAKSLMAWTMLTSFRERDHDIFIRLPSHLHAAHVDQTMNHFSKEDLKKKSGFRIDPDLLAIKTKQLQSILTSVFLSVITADHLLLGGNSRSTVYQLTPPLNLSRKKYL